MTEDDELKAWQANWQSNAAPGLDVQALRRKVLRKNRKERRFTQMELVGSALVALACLYLAVLGDSSPLLRVVFVMLAAFVSGFSIWSARARASHWRDKQLNPTELISNERRRLDTRQRYWRVSAWGVTALWCALVIAALLVSPYSQHSRGLFISAAVNLPVVLFTIAFAALVRLYVRRRREQLDSVAAELGLNDQS